MSTIKDGGPAYPCELRPTEQAKYLGFATASQYAGMTLRDYFAAKAMQAFLSTYPKGVVTSPLEDVAADAYEVANAMLKARGEAC